jgi:hypothetical protein
LQRQAEQFHASSKGKRGIDVASKSKDVVKKGAEYTDDQLSEISSFGDALALVRENVGEENVHSADEVLGNGFRLLDNKDLLLEVPMLLVKWDFHNGDHGEFVTIHLVTEDNRKYVVNDGSSGIRDQLMQLTSKTNTYGPLLVKKGLRRSDYKYDDNGTEKDARTYYLDTSA